VTQLTAAQLQQSAATIASVQTADGLCMWFEGGHADPWNHVEAAMALDIAGRTDDALRAYHWLSDNQHVDGSWYQYYTATGVEETKRDANTIAYPSSGVWHHYLTTGDSGFLVDMWPTIEKSIDWVLALQQPTGEIIWAREDSGQPDTYALLTGSSSMVHSIRSALNIASVVEKDRSDWRVAVNHLADAVAHRPGCFEPKARWAMDWYYPVLAGVVTGDPARARLRAAWDRFVISGEGVRCVDDHPWVTTGETAEAAIACVAAGMLVEADLLMRWIAQMRHADGSYWTGLHVPDRIHFPDGERTTYSTAAVILADDARYGTSNASALFR
jgi:hypothetical protein